MSEAAAKKDIQKLQRAIVDGLQDVKAQDIRVFNTEHMSPLFERVVVASGTSNRQTRALASSVRDQVRTSGFAKPRMEGEDNGEWIIVDCGQAVVHIMQPAIRQYYNLEEIWGEKPVRLKGPGSAAAKSKKATPKRAAKADAQAPSASEPARAPAKPRAVKQTSATPAVAKRTPAKRPASAKAGGSGTGTGSSAARATAPRKRASTAKPAPAAARPSAKTPSRAGAPARTTAAKKATGRAAPGTSARPSVAKPAAAKKAAPRKRS